MNVSHYIGDITQATTDAIVNAANPTLLGGGGVDGAIHRAAGPALRRECLNLPKFKANVRCPVGHAVVTDAYDLPGASYIIHTVGPIYPRGRDPMYDGEVRLYADEADKMLASCLRSCLLEAEKLGLQSISFPAISCGFYGCLPVTFARVLKQVTEEKDWQLEQLDVVLFSEAEDDQFQVGWEGRPGAEEDILSQLLCEEGLDKRG